MTANDDTRTLELVLGPASIHAPFPCHAAPPACGCGADTIKSPLPTVERGHRQCSFAGTSATPRPPLSRGHYSGYTSSPLPCRVLAPRDVEVLPSATGDRALCRLYLS